jgi:hypothetical protein
MYQLLVTVNIIVDDLARAVSTMRDAIGMPEPRPSYFASAPGIDVVFCRVNPVYAVAPTRLEFVASAPTGDLAPGEVFFPVDFLGSQHGDRPFRIHATQIAMPDDYMGEIGDHLRRTGVVHRFEPGAQLERLWIGGESPGEYDPSFDAGLIFEGCPVSVLGLPDEALTAPADVPPDTEPGSMVRIVNWRYLVEDLDKTLSVLSRNLLWEAASIRDDIDGRCAVMSMSAPRSATIEFVEPLVPGHAAAELDAHGAGPWTVQIGVFDLDAKAVDLEARGTPFSRAPSGAIRIDPTATLDIPFEFVELAVPA